MNGRLVSGDYDYEFRVVGNLKNIGDSDGHLGSRCSDSRGSDQELWGTVVGDHDDDVQVVGDLKIIRISDG